jgi:hypothetical protein
MQTVQQQMKHAPKGTMTAAIETAFSLLSVSAAWSAGRPVVLCSPFESSVAGSTQPPPTQVGGTHPKAPWQVVRQVTLVSTPRLPSTPQKPSSRSSLQLHSERRRLLWSGLHGGKHPMAW